MRQAIPRFDKQTSTWHFYGSPRRHSKRHPARSLHPYRLESLHKAIHRAERWTTCLERTRKESRTSHPDHQTHSVATQIDATWRLRIDSRSFVRIVRACRRGAENNRTGKHESLWRPLVGGRRDGASKPHFEVTQNEERIPTVHIVSGDSHRSGSHRSQDFSNARTSRPRH
jgi:hypothetical protein